MQRLPRCSSLKREQNNIRYQAVRRQQASPHKRFCMGDTLQADCLVWVIGPRPEQPRLAHEYRFGYRPGGDHAR